MAVVIYDGDFDVLVEHLWGMTDKGEVATLLKKLIQDEYSNLDMEIRCMGEVD